MASANETGWPATGPSKWGATLAVAIGVFMSTLDGSIVMISLPTIQDHFDSHWSTIQWVHMAYLLTVASLLLAAGRLADLLGRRGVYVTGLALFSLGALCCGLSQDPAHLIGSRVLQGVGSALVMANGSAIITAVFPASQRGLGLGIIGTVVSAGLVTGPPLGGLIAGSPQWGWPWIFLINVPIGVVAVALSVVALRGLAKPVPTARFDFVGAALLLVSLTCLLLALSMGQERGWTTPLIVWLFVGFGLALGLFVALEVLHRHPLLDFALFRSRVFSSATAAGLLGATAGMSLMFLMPFYLERALGAETRLAGFILMSVPACIALASPASGALSDRIGTRAPTVLGLALACLALVWLSGLGTGVEPTDVVPGLLLFGIGFGMFGSPNNSAIMGAVPKDSLGTGSGMVALVRVMGQVMGIAVAGAVFAATVAPGQAAQRARDILSAAGTPDVVARGLHNALLVGAAIAAAAVLAAALRGGSRPPHSEEVGGPIGP